MAERAVEPLHERIVNDAAENSNGTTQRLARELQALRAAAKEARDEMRWLSCQHPALDRLFALLPRRSVEGVMAKIAYPSSWQCPICGEFLYDDERDRHLVAHDERQRLVKAAVEAMKAWRRGDYISSKSPQIALLDAVDALEAHDAEHGARR